MNFYNTSMSFSKLIVVLSAVLLLFISTYSAAAVRTIKFTNTTGKDVNDLHINSATRLTVDSTDFPSDRTAGVSSTRHNLWGFDVDKGKSTEVTFSNSSINLTLSTWYWTLGGNAISDGDRIGKIRKDTYGSELAFNDDLSNGDGLIALFIGGNEHLFATEAGLTGEQSATSFYDFLSGINDGGFDLLHETPTGLTTVSVYGNLLGDSSTELAIQVRQQDTGQTILNRLLVPEPSTLAIFALSLIGLASRRFKKS